MNTQKIKQWYIKNQFQISWFIIGWLATSGIKDILMGNVVGGVISLAFAYLNYALQK